MMRDPKKECAFEAEDINPDIVRAVEEAQAMHDPAKPKSSMLPLLAAVLMIGLVAWFVFV